MLAYPYAAPCIPSVGFTLLAEGGPPLVARPAGSTCHVEGHRDAITASYPGDAGSDLDDDPHVFVTEDGAVSAPARPSYMCRSDPQMFVVVILMMASVACSMAGSSTSSMLRSLVPL